MKDKTGKMKLFTGISFLFAGILYMIKRNYYLGSVLIVAGAYYLMSMKKNNNTDNKPKQNKVTYDLRMELRQLMLQGKKGSQIKAINKYRKATGGGLKEAKEYTDSLKY